MTKTLNFLVLDAGNTVLKWATFQGDTLLEDGHINYSDTKAIQSLSNNHSTARVIISSVLDDSATEELVNFFPTSILMSHSLVLPLSIVYSTPHTLGADRLANAVAANRFRGNNAALIIDAGTCLKFDFVDKNGNYHGGSIGPGVHMRFKAMHDYTGKLPLITKTDKTPLIGSSTDESLRSGVINAMKYEILGMIEAYRAEHGALTIFMTGGDAPLFDIPRKNGIFADDKLTLKGLKIILEKNVK